MFTSCFTSLPSTSLSVSQFLFMSSSLNNSYFYITFSFTSCSVLTFPSCLPSLTSLDTRFLHLWTPSLSRLRVCWDGSYSSLLLLTLTPSFTQILSSALMLFNLSFLHPWTARLRGLRAVLRQILFARWSQKEMHIYLLVFIRRCSFYGIAKVTQKQTVWGIM